MKQIAIVVCCAGILMGISCKKYLSKPPYEKTIFTTEFKSVGAFVDCDQSDFWIIETLVEVAPLLFTKKRFITKNLPEFAKHTERWIKISYVFQDGPDRVPLNNCIATAPEQIWIKVAEYAR
jgi:hypothetical protein